LAQADGGTPLRCRPPERCAEAQPRREVEHDLQVRAGLAARRDQRLSELDERLRLLADFEADL